MIKTTGKLFQSVSGGYVASIEIQEIGTGYIFVQAPDYKGIESGIREAFGLHLRITAPIHNWTLTSLKKIEKENYIVVSETPFTAKIHDYIIKTGICQRHSATDSNDFVSYVIGGIRLTLPKFENDSAKPELLGEMFTAFSKALQNQQDTKDRVDELTDFIFAREID